MSQLNIQPYPPSSLSGSGSSSLAYLNSGSNSSASIAAAATSAFHQQGLLHNKNHLVGHHNHQVHHQIHNHNSSSSSLSTSGSNSATSINMMNNRPGGPNKNPSTTSLITSLTPASSLPSPINSRTTLGPISTNATITTNAPSGYTSGMVPSGPLAVSSLASNRPADSSESLFQICLALKQRLLSVPGLQAYLEACETDFDDNSFINDPAAAVNGSLASARTSTSHISSPSLSGVTDFSSVSSSSSSSTQTPASGGSPSLTTTVRSPSISGGAGFAPHLNTVAAVPPGMKIDPVTHVWRFLRMGTSLCALYNALNPPISLPATLSNDIKVAKRALYGFIQACKSELQYSDDQLFTISNVYSDSTTVLLKVIRTVTMLLDALECRGVIPPLPKKEPSLLREMDQRAKVVDEILQTERKYVQDLELLARYQNEIQQANILSPDTLHFLFPNLFQLLDFQRQFLVAIEYHASLAPEEQRLGYLFEVSERGFEVYEGYAMNQRNATDLATAECSKLMPLSHIVEPTYELQAMLIKPIQRICKYPLLLRELIKCTPEDWPYYEELQSGLAKIKKITNNVNETQRRVENVEVVKELNERLRDWRGHNLEDFGDLLHDGMFPVVKVGFEREYHLYLFENIILCCKEAVPSAAKKSMGLSSKKNKSKRSSLVLKGRIYMAYITDVFVTKKDGYLLHISWGKDDASDTGYFDIRFRNEEILAQWESTIKRMVARYQDSANELFQAAQFIDDEEPNHTTYDDGSDDELLAGGDDDGISPLTSEVNSSRTTSTSSNYTFNGIHQLNGDFSALGLSTAASSIASSNQGTNSSRSREGSNASLLASANLSAVSAASAAAAAAAASQPLRLQSRNRSASTPNNYPGNNPINNMNASTSSLGFPGGTGTMMSPPIPNLLQQQQQHQQQYHQHQFQQKQFQQQQQQQQQEQPQYPQQPMLATRIKSESALSTKASGGSNSGGASPVLTSGKSHSNQMKVKLHYLEDTFLLIVPVGILYSQLLERVDRKIRLCGKQTPSPLRIKYKDEDDDFVTITSDEDIQMALELKQELSDEKNFNDILTIWAA